MALNSEQDKTSSNQEETVKQESARVDGLDASSQESRRRTIIVKDDGSMKPGPENLREKQFQLPESN